MTTFWTPKWVKKGSQDPQNDHFLTGPGSKSTPKMDRKRVKKQRQGRDFGVKKWSRSRTPFWPGPLKKGSPGGVPGGSLFDHFWTPFYRFWQNRDFQVRLEGGFERFAPDLFRALKNPCPKRGPQRGPRTPPRGPGTPGQGSRDPSRGSPGPLPGQVPGPLQTPKSQ